jgi:ADP-ribosylglycohydrolase
MRPRRDAALGALLGTFVGDALGMQATAPAAR